MMKQTNILNNTVSKSDEFIQSVQGIGDILVFETKRKTGNKDIISGLNKITEIIKTFFDIQKNNPDKFQQLFVGQEFLDAYKKDDGEAKDGLSLDPNKYLNTLSTAINQFIRIHEAALDAKNEEISRFAIYHFIWLLADITTRPNNDSIVVQLLQKLTDVSRIAIDNKDNSMYAASIHWYTDIVYNKFGQTDGIFDISYLEQFDRFFFSSVMHIISQNQTTLFESLKSSLVDGINVPSYLSGGIWDYGDLILKSGIENKVEIHRKLDEEHQLTDRIRELADSENDVDSIEKRNQWLNSFEDVKKILTPYLDNDQQQNASIIEDEIREFVDGQLKYNNLLDIVFAIGAFCLFKQKPEYIKEIWECKQPSDSDALWAGHDIVPNTIDSIAQFYFKKSVFENKFGTWEGHHGSGKYYKEYFLLILARNLQTIRANKDGIYEIMENYKLPDMTVYRLNDLDYSIDGLIELAKELKSQKDTLGPLGFDLTVLDELFEDKLIKFLDILKIRAQERINDLKRSQSISSKKVDEFKDDVLKKYKKSTIFRDIFEYYGLYYDQTSEKYDGELERFGMNRVDDRAAFFNEWYVHYGNFGINYGRVMAVDENSLLFKNMANTCIEITDNEFEKTLENFDNLSNVLIFGVNIKFHTFFKKSNNFKPKLHRDTRKLDVNGFIGYYSFNNEDIPIFKIRDESANNQILLLNKNRMGKLVQYSPLNEGEDKKLMNGILYMNVQDFSDNHKLMDETIETAPEWLKKYGDKEKQKEHLREKVLIHIFERFEYRIPEDFEGYLLKV